MQLDSDVTYEDDVWGLGESSLILIEDEIEESLNIRKENDHERRSDIVES